MYQQLKHIIKRVLPESAVTKYKKNFRHLISLAYRGQKYQCNICNTKLRKFIPVHTNDLMCPKCGSLPRSRGLWKILKTKIKNKTVLHFSPSPALKNVIENDGNAKRYITTDYVDEFESEFNINIEDINLESNSIDLIICFHILEHVENDRKALEELYRILNKGGTCYIQTPFKEGDIYENPSIIDPAERLKHFHQEDHVRIYSAEGLKNRMKDAGFKTEIQKVNSGSGNYNGLKSLNVVLIGKKS